MAKITFSTKRVLIDRANVIIVAAIAIATFLTVFSLFTCKALLSQRSYQSKVIAKREKARDQLKANINAVAQLQTSYRAFVDSPQNVIGGSASGKGDKDGDNAKIILDALPSQYDFPALATSLEKIVKDNGVAIVSIGGTDDEVNQAQNDTAPVPTAIAMPFTLAGKGSYADTKKLLTALQRSIRPFEISQLTLAAAGSGQININIVGNTYYQPGKSLSVKSEVVK